jgi:uncharacterized paraquat-inducible protein A
MRWFGFFNGGQMKCIRCPKITPETQPLCVRCQQKAQMRLVRGRK